MRKLINRILVRLGLREPPLKILIPKFIVDEAMEKFNTIGWKWYGGYGVIGTGNVKVERSKEHEQT